MKNLLNWALPRLVIFTLFFSTQHFLALPVSAQTKTKKPKYNVLFIVSDDCRPELGTYGVTGIKTPNIDKLASQGTQFNHAYAQFPVCNPSRTSFMTGRYPTETKVLNNNDYFRKIDPTTVTLAQYFMNNGYVTLRSGKQ